MKRPLVNVYLVQPTLDGLIIDTGIRSFIPVIHKLICVVFGFSECILIIIVRYDQVS